MTKHELLGRGAKVMLEWCALNGVPAPTIYQADLHAWNVDACAYYRQSVTHICVARCAPIGTVGRQWSYPGYTVDRTPYGVVQHELGHHVDVLRSGRKGSYFGDFSIGLRGHAGEAAITSYCPNDAEWFAEMFRVFVTNPDLLRLVRPRTFRELTAAHLKPVFSDSWRDRLQGAPARTLAAAEKHIDRARVQTSASAPAPADLFDRG